ASWSTGGDGAPAASLQDRRPRSTAADDPTEVGPGGRPLTAREVAALRLARTDNRQTSIFGPGHELEPARIAAGEDPLDPQGSLFSRDQEGSAAAALFNPIAWAGGYDSTIKGLIQRAHLGR